MALLQSEVLASLPPSLKKAFEEDDEQAMKTALKALDPAEKKEHWDRITASGLWTPTKVWRNPIPKASIQAVSAANAAAAAATTAPPPPKPPGGTIITGTFNGPLGLGLQQGKDGGAVVGSVDENSPAYQLGCSVGDTIVSINGKSTVGMSKSEVISTLKASPKPWIVRIAKPAAMTRQLTRLGSITTMGATTAPEAPPKPAAAPPPPAPPPSAKASETPPPASPTVSVSAMKAGIEGVAKAAPAPAPAAAPSSGGMKMILLLLLPLALAVALSGPLASLVAPPPPPLVCKYKALGGCQPKEACKLAGLFKKEKCVPK